MIVRETPTPRRPAVTQSVNQAAGELLATLPEVVGGEHLDGVQIVDDAFHVGHRVDDILEELHKERRDAIAVFRHSEDATIGATQVIGIAGPELLEAFVNTWNAPAMLDRRQRTIGGRLVWELRDRGGRLTVIYLFGNVVYLVETTDAALLDAILLEMPPFRLR
jgi:hypothetical protein